MECKNIQEELSAFIDDQLSDEERQRVEEHLKGCSKCGLELEELKRTVAQMQRLEEVEPPAWLSQRVMTKVREEAGERKKVFRKMYFPFQIKVPVSIFAMLAISVTAYFLFRTIDPEIGTALTRSQEQIASVKERDESTGQLLLKQELKTPAEPAAPAAKKSLDYEYSFRADKAKSANEAAGLAEDGTAFQDSSGVKTDEMSQRAVQSAEVYGDKLQTINLVVHVKDIGLARKDIEKAVRDLGGEITGTESFQNKDVLSVTVGSDTLKELDEILKDVGEIKGLVDMDRLEGVVSIKIEIMHESSMLQ